MASQKQSTMKDVAILAGVSIQTVSAIINDKPGISPETSTRVKEAIQQLDYRPNSGARSLRTRQTHTLALILTDINNPSLATIASAAEDIAHSFGYNLVLYNTHDDLEREANYVRTVSQRWMDGVILVATGDQMTSLDSLEQAGIPTVVIDRIPMGYSGPSVTLDNFMAGQIAADYLVKLGHRRITQIVGPLNLLLARERSAGFKDGLKRAGLVSTGLVSSEGDWTCQSGYQAMQQILGGPEIPTALFVANDRMAIGAIKAIMEKGMHVPEDISVIGVDDIEVSSFQSPPLTTIRQSFKEMASKCVCLLIEILAGKEPAQLQIVMEPQLIERKSTTIPRKG
jgi:DNA-binding LacI/PurR family transcriptional regulator